MVCLHSGCARRAFTLLVPVTVVLAAVVLGAWGCGGKVPPKKQPPSAAAPHGSALRAIAGRKVLFVNSYDVDNPWGASITKGVEEGLRGSDVQLEVLYMDTKRRTDEEWKIQAGQKACQKVDQWQPDVIIASDDNAQQYFAEKYVGSSLPIVFCGVNQDPSRYGYPAANATGILERPNLRATLELLRTLRPVSRIAVISDDCQTSVGAVNFIKQVAADVEIVDIRTVSTFQEWKEVVLELNGKVDALGIYDYHTIKETAGGQSMDAKSVMDWTRANATMPTFGFAEFAIKDGVMAGVVQSPEEHGRKAANYALEILRGVPMDALPMIRATCGQRMVNTDEVARLHLALPSKGLADTVLIASRIGG
jgi:ABC-type uncharacterized transport system substrate-binding protein